MKTTDINLIYSGGETWAGNNKLAYGYKTNIDDTPATFFDG